MASEDRVITVYGRRDSSAVARLMWTIGELGLAYHRVDVGGAFGGLNTPDHRALNPSGTIPAMVLADGRALWESNSIIRYLCAAHSLGALSPADPVTRAQAEAWMDWASALGRAVGAVRGVYKTKGATPASCQNAIAKAGPVLDILERRLGDGRAFVMGEGFTLADLSLGVIAHRLMRCPPELDLPALPGISAWYARLCDRAAYQEHVLACVSAGPQTIG